MAGNLIATVTRVFHAPPLTSGGMQLEPLRASWAALYRTFVSRETLVNQKPLGPSTGFQRLLLIYVDGDGGTFVFFPQFLSLFVGFAALMQAALDDV